MLENLHILSLKLPQSNIHPIDPVTYALGQSLNQAQALHGNIPSWLAKLQRKEGSLLVF